MLTTEGRTLFPTIETPQGTTVILCAHVDQNCAKITWLASGDVEIGSTLHESTVVLSSERFLALIVLDDETLALESQVEGSDAHSVTNVLNDSELADFRAYIGEVALELADARAVLAVG